MESEVNANDSSVVEETLLPVDDEDTVSSKSHKLKILKQTNHFGSVDEHGQNANVGSQFAKADRVAIENMDVAINLLAPENKFPSKEMDDRIRSSEPTTLLPSLLNKIQTSLSATTGPYSEDKLSAQTKNHRYTNSSAAEATSLPSVAAKSSSLVNTSQSQPPCKNSSRAASRDCDNEGKSSSTELPANAASNCNDGSCIELSHMGHGASIDGGEQRSQHDTQGTNARLDENTGSLDRQDRPAINDTLESPKSLSRRFTRTLKAKKDKAQHRGKKATRSVLKTLTCSMSCSIRRISRSHNNDESPLSTFAMRGGDIDKD